MQYHSSKKQLFFIVFLIFQGFNLTAQTAKPEKKYPSLLWEITGNKLKKPSYLFGTMHVSNKMVFHLSDSFFHAIKSVDVVGLELNSDTWQQEMVAMDKQKASYYKFYGGGYSNSSSNYGKGTEYNNAYAYGGDGIKDYTFRMENSYLYAISYALQETPYIINSLLYRTRDYRQDFEENTFLDMYIYQTGKKLGKKSAGMETIFTMEKYTTEAEIDRANEKVKKKKKFNYDDMPEMTSDEAYRKGDLDMLDSLDRMTMESEAFIEKFLYQRNDVQAHSMDTIMQKGQSLFVGVGAAHLAGKRGVIEILRRKGYKLRPIKMVDRDAGQRDAIDKIKVPVQFQDNVSEDNFYKVRVPGQLYGRSDVPGGLSAQYADMSNGAYYMVTRVPTLSSYFNLSESLVQQKIDSLLYENVPGKILKKIKIVRNGYTGLDVTNKTRRGDIQRYHIFITPFEVLIFKMSGNENYVQGKEAEEFFNSIQLKERKINWASYTNKLGNYSCFLPQEPYSKGFETSNISTAIDKEKSVLYLIQKKIFSSYDFKIEDTFNIMLMEESFIGHEKKLKTLNRNFSTDDGTNVLLANYAIADSFMQVKYMVKGKSYYIVAAKGKDKKAVLENKTIPSFKLLGYSNDKAQLYTDTFLKFTVKTPFVPVVVDSIKSLLYRYGKSNRYGYGSYGISEDTYQSWGKYESMTFSNDTTGEEVNVSFYQASKYQYTEDSLKKYKLMLDSMEKVLNSPTKLAKYFDSLHAKRFEKWLKTNSLKKEMLIIEKLLLRILDLPNW
jgi:uncharacterized protein YbaP (TraB family)